jgi:protease IV
VGSVVALMFGTDSGVSGANTAIIRIEGPIAGESAGGLFAESGTSSADAVMQLERARDDDRITSVILEINSPGGSAVASDEIAQAVKGVRAEGKPVVAWIRESGASGAYWIASGADHVVANRMSITGSIGVISSYLEFSGFIDDWNVTHNRLVSGEMKDVGDPFERLTPQRRDFLQGKLDRVHGFFVEEVARNRNLSIAQVEGIADGSFYLGVEAEELGLVDELGGKEEALAWLERETGEEPVTEVFEEDDSFVDALLGTLSPAPAPTVEDLARTRMLREQMPVMELR